MSEVKENYLVVSMPAPNGISEKIHQVAATSIEEVRKWALANVNTRQRWIIKKHGKNLGEAIVSKQYRYDPERRKECTHEFNTTCLRRGYFHKPGEARADYLANRPQANDILERVWNDIDMVLAKHGCRIEVCEYEGACAVVEVGNHEYRRPL